MSWYTEWNAVQGVISELDSICSEFVSAMDASNQDTFGSVKKTMIPMAESLGGKISLLGKRYESQLPKDALDCISKLKPEVSEIISYAIKRNTSTATEVAHISNIFRKFRADFNYLTSDLDGLVVKRTARAFTHLQRSIIADSDIQKKWITAFKKHETACEKLGSAHLLLHGIWTFKADTIGGRTDLILGEPINETNLNEVYLTAEGLVLTEWKRVLDPKNIIKNSETAFKQAKIYSAGSLAAIELKRYRYLVLVSCDYLSSVPGDKEDDGIIYKYINISVNPSTPSQAARKRT